VPTNATGSQPSVDEEATSPFLTCVGGTQFTPVYLSSGADASLVGDGLEVAWNGGNKDATPPCPNKNATGGGRSVVFTKPSWQAGLNVPDDGYRDIPDIAIGANGKDSPAFFVYSRSAGSSSVLLVATGGTSIATPMWAGISRLIAQAQGVTRLGNINQRLYELGNLQSLSSGLHDVTSGNNDNSSITGYSADVGYDQVTGWGSPNIAMLVNAFPGAAFSGTSPAPTVPVARGTTSAAAIFSIANTTADALELTGIKLTATSPKLLSSVQASATAAGVTESVSAATAKSTVLTFSSPLSIPSGKSAKVTLAVTAANKKGSSNLSLGSGAVSIGDGQGGIVQVGGLPFSLCKVTVK